MSPQQAPDLTVDERSSLPEAVRDTVIDPPPSMWERIKSGAGFLLQALFPARFEDRTTELSRPAAVAPSDEAAERMLLGILRASPTYQRAALSLARAALASRRSGEKEFVELVVHFTLSRMRSDERGRITIPQIRELLGDLPYSGVLAPALIRLEEQGVVALTVDTTDGDPMTELLRSRITHIELKIPWSA